MYNSLSSLWGKNYRLPKAPSKAFLAWRNSYLLRTRDNYYALHLSILMKNSRPQPWNQTYLRPGRDRVSRACEIDVSPRPQEFAQDTLISPLDSPIIYLFILFRPASLSCGGRYHHRYWRSTRESSDSFRRVRNNLLNYRMPKVTSTRREAGEGGGGGDGGEGKRGEGAGRITGGGWWV